MPESKIALITKALFVKYHNDWILPHIARKAATSYWGGFRRLIFSANGETVEPEIVSDESTNLWINFTGPINVYTSEENDLNIEVDVPTMEGATAETTGAPGLVPFQGIADKDKFLKGDGSWSTPSVPIMVGSGAGAAAGLVPTPPSTVGTTKFLREDGAWSTPNVPIMVGSGAAAAAGLVPTPPSEAGTTKFLCEDGTWSIPSVPVMIGSGAGAAAGLVPTPPSTAGTTKFLCEDGTWKAAGGGGGDANAVTIDTAQTITGAKEFTVSPEVPTPSADDDSQNAVNTAWITNILESDITALEGIASGQDPTSEPLLQPSNIVTVNGDQTITGQKTFNKDPIGSNGFSYFPVPNSAAAHNCLFRGADLSQKYTIEELSALVQAGDFSDIYIGDYYPMEVTIDGTAYNLTCRVADIDYFVHNGDTETTAHHIVFVPDEVIMTNQVIMNATNTTVGGFVGSKAWTTIIPLITAGLQNAFGANHILQHQRNLTNSVNTNSASMAGAGWKGATISFSWYDTYACFLNEVMVYGCTVFSSSAFDVADGDHQFALFRLAKEYVSKLRGVWWLTSVANSTTFSCVGSHGRASADDASRSAPTFGARPYFLFA